MLREGVTLAQQEKKNIYTLVHKAILWLKEKYTKVSCMLKIWLQIFLRRCASYKMYLKGDSPHQMVMIMMWMFMIFS